MGLRMIMMLGLVLAMGVMKLGEAQTTATCAKDLIPCADYINSTKPPSTCCDPLKKTVETQLACLCNLFFTPGLLQSFNINVTQALELSRHCGVTSGIDSCKKTGSAPSPSSSSSSVPPPPATPGSDKGGAGRVAFTGLSFLLLFWASMLF